MDRARFGLQTVAEEVGKGNAVHSVKLNNISAQELFTIKYFFLESLSMFDHMKQPNTSNMNASSGFDIEESNNRQNGRTLRRRN